MTKYFLFFALSFSILSGPVNSSDLKANVNEIIENGKKACGPSFQLKENAVKYIDMSGDGEIDVTVVDEHEFFCPDEGYSYYCGSGGCMVYFLAETDQLEGLIRGWEVLQSEWGDKIILLALHGSSCRQAGAVPCFKAISFYKGRFVSQKR